MKEAALVLWILTALGGMGLYLLWLRAGGTGTDALEPRGSQAAPAPAGDPAIRTSVVALHAALAVVAGAFWAVAVATTTAQTDSIRWLSLALLAGGAGVGLLMFVRWRQRRHPGTPEDRLPPAAVYGHGLLAAATAVLAVVAAVSWD